MLVATIEIWPYGVEAQKYKTAKVFIANVEDLGFGHCGYRAQVRRDDDLFPFVFSEDNSVYFEHARQSGDLECVRRALAAIEEDADDLHGHTTPVPDALA
jgi:hypothetical protein